MMQIDVLLFAGLRDRYGTERMMMTLSDGATPTAVYRELAGDSTAAAQLMQFARCAVNRTYVTNDHVLRDGDEVALIPPVSGG